MLSVLGHVMHDEVLSLQRLMSPMDSLTFALDILYSFFSGHDQFTVGNSRVSKRQLASAVLSAILDMFLFSTGMYPR